MQRISRARPAALARRSLQSPERLRRVRDPKNQDVLFPGPLQLPTEFTLLHASAVVS